MTKDTMLELQSDLESAEASLEALRREVRTIGDALDDIYPALGEVEVQVARALLLLADARLADARNVSAEADDPREVMP